MKTYNQFITELGGGRGVRVRDPLQDMMGFILKGAKIETIIKNMKDGPKELIIKSLENMINGKEPLIRTSKKITNKRKEELKKELESLK